MFRRSLGIKVLVQVVAVCTLRVTIRATSILSNAHGQETCLYSLLVTVHKIRRKAEQLLEQVTWEIPAWHVITRLVSAIRSSSIAHCYDSRLPVPEQLVRKRQDTNAAAPAEEKGRPRADGS
jgi:GGDEF domain-containing protein